MQFGAHIPRPDGLVLENYPETKVLPINIVTFDICRGSSVRDCICSADGSRSRFECTWNLVV